MMPKSFFPSFFLSCEEFLFFVMWNISLTPQCPPDASQRWMVSSIFPAVGVPLLQLSPSSISACWNVLHGVCTSRDASPVSPAEPPLPLFSAIPTTYQPMGSSVVLPPGKQWVENQSHQHLRSTENVNVAVLNLPKIQKKISPPLQRERQWGREWAKPESSGALPKPLEACDRSLIYPSTREIGSMCLFHSWTVSDSNSYLCRDAIKHIRNWVICLIYLYTNTHTDTHTLLSALAL